MISLAIAGFAMIGAGLLMQGSIALVLARGALGTLFPAAVARIYPDNKVTALARNQTWRDVGAAAGPLATGAGLAFIAPEMMHIFVSAAFVIAFSVFVMSPGWRAVTRVV
jgi:hypothetical protein